MELWATLGELRRRPFYSMDCVVWNIAATTPPGSLSSTADGWKRVNARDASAALAKRVRKQPVSGSFGISHTRWATHGGVTDQNAHPHFDASGKLALVHNGVIENYQALKDELIRDGDTNFRSETDTEVLAHLIGKLYDDSCASTVDAHGKKARLFDAVRTALRQVIGTYGIALVHADVPDFMIGARRGSPLVLGVGNGENFLASDVSAIVAYTRDAVYLNDFDVVAAGTDKFEISFTRRRQHRASCQQSRVHRRGHQEG